MSIASIATPYDNGPDRAVDAILAHEGPIFVDLDETLYLRNSTEDFINCARPALLALLLLRALDIIEPWRWTGGIATRDVWRVRLVMLLFPWVKRRWQHRVAEFARQYGNRLLVNTLKKRVSPPIVVTLGFQPVVTSLIAALGFGDSTIIAARLTHPEDRLHGKLLMVTDKVGQSVVRNALFITDSPDDLPLLEACIHSLRVVWPESHHCKAFAHIYLPGQYISQVKHPGARSIMRGILQEDFPLWVLSSLALAMKPALHVAGLLFLFTSFWVIYEEGYADNDFIAARFETDPQLSAEYWKAPVVTPSIQPWIWAATFGVIAIMLLRWPANLGPKDLLKWATVLVSTHLWFKLYNRYDKSTRIWMYPFLKLARSAAFLVLVPIVEVGIAAIGAHVIARWMPYFIYRLSGKQWMEGPSHLMRLVFFSVLGLLLAIAVAPSRIFNWTGFALLVWNAYRARNDLRKLLISAKRLDRHCTSLDEGQRPHHAMSQTSTSPIVTGVDDFTI